MKRNTPAAACLIAIGILALPFLSFAEQKDIPTKLEAFGKKIPDATTTTPEGAVNQIALRWHQQLMMLKMYLARGNFDQVRNTLRSMSDYGLSAELMSEWLEISTEINKEIDAMEAKSLINWQSDVDRLVVDVRKACLSAAKAEDLDSLLVRCVPLQMRRQQQSNVQGTRINYKLSGCAETLQIWAKYLDYRNAGNAKSANDQLRNLLTAQSQYPVLTQAEIKGALMEDPSNKPIGEIIIQCFSGINTPGDLTEAIDRLKKVSREGAGPDAGGLKTEINKVEQLRSAWESALKKDQEACLKSLEKISSYGGYPDNQALYDSMKRLVILKLVENKSSIWTKITPLENDDPATYLSRLISEKLAEENFSEAVEIMTFADTVYRQPAAGYVQEKSVIEKYMAAKRFESVGDDFSALSNYRSVVGAQAVKLAPQQKAEAAMKRLIEKHPEWTKSSDTAIMAEIQALRQQLQMIRPSITGRPN